MAHPPCFIDIIAFVQGSLSEWLQNGKHRIICRKWTRDNTSQCASNEAQYPIIAHQAEKKDFRFLIRQVSRYAVHKMK